MKRGRHRGSDENSMDREIAFHIDEQAVRYMEQGLSP